MEPTTQTETQINIAFQKWLKENTPKGTRLCTDRHQENHINVLCCGEISWRALTCNRSPHHIGECFNANKQVYFDSEIPRI